MRKKIRLLTTLFSLLIVGVLLVISTTIGLSAASSANVSGSGNLSYTKPLDPSETKDILEAAGIHVTGLQDDGSYQAQSNNKYTATTLEDNSEARQNAFENEILSFELYKKIDCETQKPMIELQVVIDLSRFNLRRYAREFLEHYNYIVFYTDETTCSNIKIYDFYNDNYYESTDLTINNGSFSVSNNFSNLPLKYAYKVIVNSAQYINENQENSSNLRLSNGCFNMTALVNNELPNVIYVDFSQTNISVEETENDLIVNGIEYGDDKDVQNPDQVDLTNIQHIHVIGSNNNHYKAAMVLVSDYLADHKDYEISIYKKINTYTYSILAKFMYYNDLTIDVVDSVYNDSGSLTDLERQSLIDMSYWVQRYINDVTVLIYHQKVNADMSFNLNERYQISYIIDSSKGENWYRVYYVDSNEVIGYFNGQNYQTVIE